MSWLSPLVFVEPPQEQPQPEVRKKLCEGGKPPRSVTKTLHERIVDLRDKGYARFEIAEILGVSRTSVSKHLNGEITLFK